MPVQDRPALATETGLAGETGAVPDRAGNLRLLTFYALLAVGYVATGRLGLLLAVPPGYATAIFPPAGIAAAAMLTAGPASLPWIFLGSLILNFWIGYGAGATVLTTPSAESPLSDKVALVRQHSGVSDRKRDSCPPLSREGG